GERKVPTVKTEDPGARTVSKGARQGVREAASTSGSGEPQKADAQQPDLMAKSQSYLQACHRQPGEGRTSARRRLLTAKSHTSQSGLKRAVTLQENHQREFGPDLQLHHRESHGDQQDDVTAGATERGGYADSSQLLTDS
ncbi:BCL2/adenovirus E1B interacting protein 1, NIP1, isoform CRA_a, partial [Mus musculus]